MSYTLFNPIEKIRVPVSIDPKHRQLKMMVDRDIENVKKYYIKRPQFLNNSHLLIKLINLLDKGVDETFNECYTRVSKTYRNPCSALGITTYATVGKMHDGEFYQNTQEYIVAIDRYFPVSYIDRDWKELEPVRVLCHEVKKLNFIQPGPFCFCDSAGYSVVEINPTMLACMYKAFCEDSISKNKLGYSITPKEFITRFVFPNMLRRHIDLVIANRSNDVANGINNQAVLDINRKSLKQPFYIFTNFKQIDSSLKYQLNNISTKVTSAQQALSNVALYHKKNLFEFFSYKTVHRTVQTDWIYALVFLKYFDILNKISKNESLTKRSKGHLYQMSKELIRNNAIGMSIKMAYKNPLANYNYILANRLINITALSGSIALRSNLIVNKILDR